MLQSCAHQCPAIALKKISHRKSPLTATILLNNPPNALLHAALANLQRRSSKILHRSSDAAPFIRSPKVFLLIPTRPDSINENCFSTYDVLMEPLKPSAKRPSSALNVQHCLTFVFAEHRSAFHRSSAKTVKRMMNVLVQKKKQFRMSLKFKVQRSQPIAELPCPTILS